MGAASSSSMVTNDATHSTYRMSRQNNRRERERSNTYDTLGFHNFFFFSKKKEEKTGEKTQERRDDFLFFRLLVGGRSFFLGPNIKIILIEHPRKRSAEKRCENITEKHTISSSDNL